MVYPSLSLIHQLIVSIPRLVFAPSDKVDVIWSGIASKLFFSSSFFFILFFFVEPHTVCSFTCVWPIGGNSSISCKSGDLSHDGNSQLSTCDLYLLARHLRQRRCYQGRQSS